MGRSNHWPNIEAGSAFASYRILDSLDITGNALNYGSNVAQEFGRVQDSELADDTAINDVQDEGFTTWGSDGARTITQTLTILQQDTETIELNVKTLRGKYISICKETEEIVDDTGKKRLQFIAQARVLSAMTFTKPGRTIQLQYRPLPLADQITQDLDEFDAALSGDIPALSSISIAKGDSYGFLDYTPE